ncbi:MAG: rhodanese-like domain-containing protein [Spirulina sp. SIO3F2]|nr:rhodanese-like domain-containing protein [Spirulina sp. SIO3F2]
MPHHLRSLLLLAVLLLSGCKTQNLAWDTLKSQIREEFPAVEHMAIAEFDQHRQATSPTKILIVDVREPEEFAVSHLQNAVNLKNPDEILRLAQQQQVEQIVLYCSVGYRSAQMAQALEQRGWEAVVNLEGSIFEWANSGRPVFLADEEVEVVHPFDPSWGQLLNRKYHQYHLTESQGWR